MRTHRGFTLIELIAGLIIIGILATFSFNMFSSARKKARDVRRKTDLQSIRLSLSQYRAINNAYPYELGISTFYSMCGRNTWPFLETALKPYLTSLPTDPQSTCVTPGTPNSDHFPWARPGGARFNGYAYVYQNVAGFPAFPSYSFWAALENPRDPARDGSVIYYVDINNQGITTPGQYTYLFRYASLKTVYSDLRNMPNLYGVGCRVIPTDPDPNNYANNKCAED